MKRTRILTEDSMCTPYPPNLIYLKSEEKKKMKRHHNLTSGTQKPMPGRHNTILCLPQFCEPKSQAKTSLKTSDDTMLILNLGFPNLNLGNKRMTAS